MFNDDAQQQASTAFICVQAFRAGLFDNHECSVEENLPWERIAAHEVSLTRTTREGGTPGQRLLRKSDLTEESNVSQPMKQLLYAFKSGLREFHCCCCAAHSNTHFIGWQSSQRQCCRAP